MRVLGWLKSFAYFWYDFIVGDDWRIAAGVVLVLALTSWLSQSTAMAVWWLLPAYMLIALPASIALRRRHRDHDR